MTEKGISSVHWVFDFWKPVIITFFLLRSPKKLTLRSMPGLTKAGGQVYHAINHTYMWYTVWRLHLYVCCVWLQLVPASLPFHVFWLQRYKWLLLAWCLARLHEHKHLYRGLRRLLTLPLRCSWTLALLSSVTIAILDKNIPLVISTCLD